MNQVFVNYWHQKTKDAIFSVFPSQEEYQWARNCENELAQVNNHPEVRTKLTQVFRYLQALNQLRNPVQREINEQQWTLWFHDLPHHPCIHRGVIAEFTDKDENNDIPVGDDFILKVSRPRLVEPPQPPKDLLP